MYQSGRHIFIYGDRGVGKSSLAATAAYQYQSVDAKPIFVSGSIDDTFKTIIANIANQALGKSRIETRKHHEKIGFSWRGLSLDAGVEISAIDLFSEIQSVGDATELLKQIAKLHSDKPVVVVDEFDAIRDSSERDKFASLLKQLGDQSVNIKFIFTGIGKTLEGLLGAHNSIIRQLETIELSRLSWEGRREIVLKAADAFGLAIDDNVNWRIAMVSDGFPYYVQLITEKMLWEAFSEPETVSELGNSQYLDGLKKSIQSINAELKRLYEKAVIHRELIYEPIVWATADGYDLDRNLQAIYESYKAILNRINSQDQPLLPREKFNMHIRRLKSKSYGEILVQVENRQGWYTYKEKMLRGFVRMQAEANGIQLLGEKEAPRQIMHTATNVRTGNYGPRIPKGIRLRNE